MNIQPRAQKLFMHKLEIWKPQKAETTNHKHTTMQEQVKGACVAECRQPAFNSRSFGNKGLLDFTATRYSPVFKLQKIVISGIFDVYYVERVI